MQSGGNLGFQGRYLQKKRSRQPEATRRRHGRGNHIEQGAPRASGGSARPRRARVRNLRGEREEHQSENGSRDGERPHDRGGRAGARGTRYRRDSRHYGERRRRDGELLRDAPERLRALLERGGGLEQAGAPDDRGLGGPRGGAEALWHHLPRGGLRPRHRTGRQSGRIKTALGLADAPAAGRAALAALLHLELLPAGGALFCFQHRLRAHRDRLPVSFGRLLLAFVEVQDLELTGFVTIDGAALTFELPGKDVAPQHVILGRRVREVDGLRDGVVRVLLERRLHADMVLGRDVHRGHVDLLHVRGDLFDVLERSLLHDVIHDVRLPEPALLELHLEVFVELLERIAAVQDALLVVREREGGLHARGDVEHHRDGARGSDVRESGVPHRDALLLVDALVVVRKDALLLGERAGHLVRRVVHDLHYLLRHVHPAL